MFYNLETFGCKVNQYESEKIAENLAKLGFFRASAELSEVVILNSCMVTEIAENKVKKLITKLRRQGKFVILTGCMANRNVQTAADISVSDKSEIGKILSKKFSVSGINPEIFTQRKTRKFIKIQDGCDRFCSYCIIPFARNVIYSKPISEIIAECEAAVAEGFREIVLIGINICAHADGLAEIVEKCSEIEGLERIRLGSIEPDIFKDIEKLSKNSKLCPHFHLSLQSGSDKILKLMNRRYTTSEYLKLVENLRTYFQDCSITTDIIVGFPEENEENFEETLKFAEKIGFYKIHVFPYSRRSGTVAAEMPQVDEKIKAKRASILKEKSKELEEKFYCSQKGKVFPVLFEHEKDPSEHIGHTPNFLTIKIPNKENCSFQGQILLTEVK